MRSFDAFLARLDRERSSMGTRSPTGVRTLFSPEDRYCTVVDGRSSADEIDAVIREEIARAETGGYVLDWKVYGHDQPFDLTARLTAAGDHPLLVHVEHHHMGHGARLLADIESLAASRGAGVLFVSTSDEIGATSLAGRDLYRDPLGALANIRIDPSHALGFWLHMGYTLVGVLPDAEGPGKPSIHLARRPAEPH